MMQAPITVKFDDATLFALRTAVANVTQGAKARCEYFTPYFAQGKVNPELNKY